MPTTSILTSDGHRCTLLYTAIFAVLARLTGGWHLFFTCLFLLAVREDLHLNFIWNLYSSFLGHLAQRLSKCSIQAGVLCLVNVQQRFTVLLKGLTFSSSIIPLIVPFQRLRTARRCSPSQKSSINRHSATFQWQRGGGSARLALICDLIVG